MLSSVFVDRPRLAIVISIVITIAGLIAIKALPDRPVPGDRPAAGGGHRHAIPVPVPAWSRRPWPSRSNSQVVGVDNMLYMKSTSGNDGSYTLIVTFAVGTDPDINTVNVQNRVSLAEAKLPDEVKRTGVSVKKKSSASCRSSTSIRQPRPTTRCSCQNYATINILDNIKRVRGVGDAFLFGGLDYSMRIWLETDRLTALGMTPNDIVDALQAQNIQAAAGRIGAQPIGDDQQFQLNIETKGRLTDPDEFENVVVRANPDGSFVRIRDVAGSSWERRTSRCVRPLQRRGRVP